MRQRLIRIGRLQQTCLIQDRPCLFAGRAGASLHGLGGFGHQPAITHTFSAVDGDVRQPMARGRTEIGQPGTSRRQHLGHRAPRIMLTTEQEARRGFGGAIQGLNIGGRCGQRQPVQTQGARVLRHRALRVAPHPVQPGQRRLGQHWQIVLRQLLAQRAGQRVDAG